jgi:hypothetical protein
MSFSTLAIASKISMTRRPNNILKVGESKKYFPPSTYRVLAEPKVTNPRKSDLMHKQANQEKSENKSSGFKV